MNKKHLLLVLAALMVGAVGTASFSPAIAFANDHKDEHGEHDDEHKDGEHKDEHKGH